MRILRETYLRITDVALAGALYESITSCNRKDFAERYIGWCYSNDTEDIHHKFQGF